MKYLFQKKEKNVKTKFIKMNELTENSKKYFVIVEELDSTPLTMAIGKESANNSFSAYQRKLKALGYNSSKLSRKCSSNWYRGTGKC